jgi:hypothetical protein
MKPMSLSQLKQRASDRFSYILIGCPNFPPATGTTTKTPFEKLTDFIDAVIEQTKSEEGQQWLRICLDEINTSWKSYEKGNLTEGRRLIAQAEEHFNNAFSKKPIEAKFIADESGASLDNEKGFPS